MLATGGTTYQTASAALTRHMQEAPLGGLLAEISAIANVDIIRMMMAAGIPARIYLKVLKRAMEFGRSPINPGGSS